MATIAPNIVGLYFAKRLDVDVAKRELSVIGLFPILAFPSFPTATVEMTVLLVVNGGRGAGILQLLDRTRILPGNPGEGEAMLIATSWIEKNPEVCGGDACIRNSRHTVYGLVEWKKLGLSDERILEHHPDLTSADLEVAEEYYASHREEIERAIQADEEA